ncbi:MocR-like pyridoxine biosynthesis transcription factor PdxR [Saccharopolyspora sp. 5N708]|uniref:MocR-like pyridoxine biosynthesis transcription factor PdxR n=1 Tax=Saccharopolyspora sp. 5N708 TaxID=3457424 RepID=UPI003FD087BE
MEFHVSLVGRTDLTGQIYRQIKAAVLDGRLRTGEALPPTRELARRLSVSRNTVSAAYDRLAAEGFVGGRTGSGTYVRPGGFDRPPDVADAQQIRSTGTWEGIRVPRLDPAVPDFDFRPGIPDVRLFPYAAWRRLLASWFRTSSVGSPMYGDPAGHPDLRAALARHVGVSRAVRANADDVLVTSGAQQAFDLIGRVLIEPGTCVAVEDPGYPPPRQLFRALGAKVVGVPVDAEGILVDRIPDTARIVYVTPSHQFPLGMPMSLPRRTALLEWAERAGAVVVEDDYDSEFRFSGRPIEPLQNLDRAGRVIYVGSMSKVLLPTLRVGFLIAPRSLRTALRAAKYVVDLHTSLPLQAALAAFIEEGLLARHIRRARTEYAARYAQLSATLHRDFADLLEPVAVTAGLHLAAVLHPGADDESICERAAAEGVAVLPLSPFRKSKTGRPGLVLGYGAIAVPDIAEGLRRLRSCLV